MENRKQLKSIYVNKIKCDLQLFGKVASSLGLSADRTTRILNSNDERLTLPKIQEIIIAHEGLKKGAAIIEDFKKGKVKKAKAA